MKALKELVHLISRHKRKQIEILGYSENPCNRYDEMYDLIDASKIDSDDDAASYFFGEGKNGKFTQYRNLRNNLFKRLINTFFFIDLKKPEFNNAQAAAHNCGKYAAAMRMLAARGARNSAAEIAHKTITPAIKYELPEIVLDIARYLRHHYTFTIPNEKKRIQYESLVSKYQNILNLTIKTESMYYNLIGPYIKSRSSKTWVSKMAKKYISDLQADLENCDSYWPQLHYRIILYIERASIHDYQGTLEICQSAINYFEGRPATTKAMLSAFYHKLIIALTMLQQYEQAEIEVEKAEKLAAPGTHNWFKGVEQHLILQFYQKKYQSAYTVFRKATSNNQFSHLPATELESWKIYEGYIHLLEEAGKLTRNDSSCRKSKYRIAKFLNEIPEYSKDKQGMNIPVILIHALFLLYRKDYDKFYDRMLALNKYADRNLKEEEGTIRSFCFIKAIVQISKAGFKAEEADKRAADWFVEMKKHPLQLSDTPYEIEPIPFEHLWELALEALD